LPGEKLEEYPKKVGFQTGGHSHGIHGTGIFTYIYHRFFSPNVGIYKPYNQLLWDWITHGELGVVSLIILSIAFFWVGNIDESCKK